MKLSIIIVHYRTYALTKQTIESILAAKLPFAYEIIVVDNASRDGSAEALEDVFKSVDKVHLIYNTDNLGFAKANNIGLKQAKGDYILLLNSDTYVKDRCLEKCLAYIEENPRIGALGCKVSLADGRLDHACKRGFPTPQASFYYFLRWDKKNPTKYGQYRACHLGENEIGEVDALTGAFMLMPRQVIYALKGLDEDFFMYGEDLDLCYRIKEAGYKIIYYPKGEIIHYKGGSSKKKRHKIIHAFHHAMWLFYKKHYYNHYPKTITYMVRGGIGLRYIGACIKNLF